MDNQTSGYDTDTVQMTHPSQPARSILEEIYSCENTEVCLIKYICGGVSLVFLVMYVVAV